jgi:Mrp family chromosome partitioning ATPase
MSEAMVMGQSARPALGTVRGPRGRYYQYGSVFEHSLAASIRKLTSQGTRTLLVTSSAPGDGKSTVAAHLARALAQSGRESVVLVDADPYRPALRREFELRGNRGLGELIDETYLTDLGKMSDSQVGVGDWIEVLRAQQRTGDLSVQDGEQVCVVRFVKGAVSCLMMNGTQKGDRLGERLVRLGHVGREQVDTALRMHESTGRMLGDLLLAMGCVSPDVIATVVREQAADRVHGLVSATQPECRFQELVEPYRAASGGRAQAEPAGPGIDSLLDGRLGHYLRDPFLANQVSSCLADTSARNLKVLPQGAKPCDFMQAPILNAFLLVLARLARTYDIVLVDTPPVSMTTPTVALAAHMDGVVLVVSAGKTQRPPIHRAVEELRRGGAKLAGVVLNHVDLSNDVLITPYYSAVVAER